MLKEILQRMPLEPIPGVEGEKGESQGICLYDYCFALKMQPGSTVVISGEDGYGVAVTLEQTGEAYLIGLPDGSWLLQFPKEKHRRRWVKNVVKIAVQEGGKV